MPLAGVGLGVIALLLGIFTMVKANRVEKVLATQGDEIAKIATIESEMRTATAKTETDMRNLRDGIQNALNQVGTEMGAIRAQVTKMEEQAKARPAPAAATKGGAAPAPTGVRNADGTYTIASGDTLAKVATKFGIRLDSLLAENPGIDPRSLRVGQKVRLPSGR